MLCVEGHVTRGARMAMGLGGASHAGRDCVCTGTFVSRAGRGGRPSRQLANNRVRLEGEIIVFRLIVRKFAALSRDRHWKRGLPHIRATRYSARVTHAGPGAHGITRRNYLTVFFPLDISSIVYRLSSKSSWPRILTLSRG